MKQYKICIKETLEMVIDCEADNIYEAIEKVEKDYKAEKYILDSTNFTNVEFKEFTE